MDHRRNCWLRACPALRPPNRRLSRTDDSFSKEGLFKADVSTLKDTQLVLHPDVPLVADKNMLWVRHDATGLEQKPSILSAKNSVLHTNLPRVDLLNRQNFTAADLDPAQLCRAGRFRVRTTSRTRFAPRWKKPSKARLRPS